MIYDCWMQRNIPLQSRDTIQMKSCSWLTPYKCNKETKYFQAEKNCGKKNRKQLYTSCSIVLEVKSSMRKSCLVVQPCSARFHPPPSWRKPGYPNAENRERLTDWSASGDCPFFGSELSQKRLWWSTDWEGPWLISSVGCTWQRKRNPWMCLSQSTMEPCFWVCSTGESNRSFVVNPKKVILYYFFKVRQGFITTNGPWFHHLWLS